MTALARSVALLLFGSGLCALIYEVAWFREFRLVFGASTSANAAVLAVFIGGLGAGGLVLGKRVDRARNPLLLYATLEAGVAILSALTPGLLLLSRKAYIALGGASSLGPFGATLVRLVLTALVLGGPTFLMGGTLPAAARSAAHDRDSARRRVGLLYGCNTLGAVAGCLLSNFLLLEVFGTRLTLWMACLVNVLVAVSARAASRSPAALSSDIATPPRTQALDVAVGDADDPGVPTWFVLVASAVAGFAFFLMELVWYRMLAPLLGGTIFTFGLILAVALFGIGLGGLFYSAFGADRRATLGAFARISLLEAIFVVVPYALGDRVATFALLIRPLGALHFGGLVASWAMVTMVVALLPSFAAGVQFPLLIALLGRGRDKVGSQTGLAYAANTAGAIAGALAGGFGLFPALSVPGSWRLVGWMLAALGLVAGTRLLHRKAPIGMTIVSIAAVGLVARMLFADGPTAVWRHSPIGVGRVPTSATSSNNVYRSWMNLQRRATRWEQDGIESTVALDARTGYSFVINGKSDGNSRIDASTQVMVGLVGALLHPHPTRAMVIGLGTGSTAGWLGALPDIERVDVAELEPAILHVAEVSDPVNHGVLHNPRVHITIGDAREQLLTSRETYDLIVSEPSNPYRAGIASLFTREYYRAARQRLADDGIFLQWMQAYEVDNRTVRTIYGTIASEFPEVETFELELNDLLLVASKKKIRHDVARIRQRLKAEPFRSGLLFAWGTSEAEGFYAHYVARSSFAKAISYVERFSRNTDDQNLVEFGFARSAYQSQPASGLEVRELALSRNEHHPLVPDGDLDWEKVEDERVAFRCYEGSETPMAERLSRDQRARVAAFNHFLSGRFRESVAEWKSQAREPTGPIETAMVAMALADSGDEAAMTYIDSVRTAKPIEADAILARLRMRQGKVDEAVNAIVSAFVAYRHDPWPWPIILAHALDTAKGITTLDPRTIPAIRSALAEPLSVLMFEEGRLDVLLTLALGHEPDDACADALRVLEPNVPWQLAALAWRARCYERIHHPSATRAARDLEVYVETQPIPFGSGLGFVRAAP